MAANQWAQAVRVQLGIGRVLPLGGPADGSWITEQAAAGTLRAAAGTPAGVRLGTLRLSVADPDRAPQPAVPAPPSALPPGPLRIEADFATVAGRPLPTVADQVRTALLEASVRELGLVVGVVDLQVSELLDEGEAPSSPADRTQGPSATPRGMRAAVRRRRTRRGSPPSRGAYRGWPGWHRCSAGRPVRCAAPTAMC